MLVALGIVYASGAWAAGSLPGQGSWREVGFLLVGIILYFGSRDALRKYYQRTAAILSGGAALPAHAAQSARSSPRRAAP